MHSKNAQLAFVFPGQGSQAKGMLNDLSTAYPLIKQTFEQASSVLHYDLWTLVQENPDDKINQTIYTQPALLAAGVALWRIWQTQSSVLPSILAGHSLGEYTALVCAQSLNFEEAIDLVAYRAQVMQEAAPAGVGAMAAVLGISGEQVIELCEEINCAQNKVVVQAANFNSLEQTVIAGEKAGVDLAIAAAKLKGAKRAIALPVSVPSHCRLMEPAAEKFAEKIRSITFKAPLMEVVRNIDATSHVDPRQIGQALIAQLHKPVQWVKTIQYFKECNISLAVECGPGAVLTGLIKRIDPQIQTECLQNVAALSKTLTNLAEV